MILQTVITYRSAQKKSSPSIFCPLKLYRYKIQRSNIRRSIPSYLFIYLSSKVKQFKITTCCTVMMLHRRIWQSLSHMCKLKTCEIPFGRFYKSGQKRKKVNKSTSFKSQYENVAEYFFFSTVSVLGCKSTLTAILIHFKFLFMGS